MQKNVASQKLIVFAFDSTTNLPKTGDAANITAYVSIDYGSVTVLGDTSATEMDATNGKGYYLFDLTQAETNGNTLLFSAKSATSNIVVIGVPATVFTDPANYPLTSIDGNGRLDIIKVAGTSQTARDIGASVLLSSGTGTGQLSLAAGLVTLASAQTFNNTGTWTGNIVGTLSTLTTYTGNTVQTGDTFARVGAAGVGLTNLGDTRIAHLDADVSGRMATFSLPTNFSALAINGSGNVTVGTVAATATNVKKNAASNGLTFPMTDSTTHLRKTGLTITGQVSIDGAAFGALTNSASEIGATGVYTINLATADTNGNHVMLLFTATGADDRLIEILTDP